MLAIYYLFLERCRSHNSFLSVHYFDCMDYFREISALNYCVQMRWYFMSAYLWAQKRKSSKEENTDSISYLFFRRDSTITNRNYANVRKWIWLSSALNDELEEFFSIDVERYGVFSFVFFVAKGHFTDDSMKNFVIPQMKFKTMKNSDKIRYFNQRATSVWAKVHCGILLQSRPMSQKWFIFPDSLKFSDKFGFLKMKSISESALLKIISESEIFTLNSDKNETSDIRCSALLATLEIDSRVLSLNISGRAQHYIEKLLHAVH